MSTKIALTHVAAASHQTGNKTIDAITRERQRPRHRELHHRTDPDETFHPRSTLTTWRHFRSARVLLKFVNLAQIRHFISPLIGLRPEAIREHGGFRYCGSSGRRTQTHGMCARQVTLTHIVTRSDETVPQTRTSYLSLPSLFHFHVRILQLGYICGHAI